MKHNQVDGIARLPWRTVGRENIFDSYMGNIQRFLLTDDATRVMAYGRRNATTVAIIAVNPGATDYSDSAASNGTRYFYVVRALDTSGNESTASNEAEPH